MERLATAARRGVVLSLCGYECISVATGRAPTITTLAGRHRWLAPALVVALAVHLAMAPGPRRAAECPMCPVAF